MNGQRNDLVGLSEDDAIAKIQKEGLKARVRKRDGKSLMVTMDFRRDRVNLDPDPII